MASIGQFERALDDVRDRDTVQRFLDTFADALVRGDGKTIATLWETPAFVISDDGVMAVPSLEEVERFFGGAKEQYNDRGVVQTHPEIERVEWVTNRICVVHVRWPWIDADSNEIGAESSAYTLRRDDNGALKLRIALMRGASVQ